MLYKNPFKEWTADNCPNLYVTEFYSSPELVPLLVQLIREAAQELQANGIKYNISIDSKRDTRDYFRSFNTKFMEVYASQHSCLAATHVLVNFLSQSKSDSGAEALEKLTSNGLQKITLAEFFAMYCRPDFITFPNF